MPTGVYKSDKRHFTFTKGHIPWNKGEAIYTLETRKKMSESHKGKPIWNKGLKGYNAGEQHYNWQGGKTALSEKIQNSLEYRTWRLEVFKRDKFTCIWCKQLRGKIEADHIKPKVLYPELIFDINNGRTLCHDCHKKTETYGGRSVYKT